MKDAEKVVTDETQGPGQPRHEKNQAGGKGPGSRLHGFIHG
jgi:hypothetical protein